MKIAPRIGVLGLAWNVFFLPHHFAFAQGNASEEPKPSASAEQDEKRSAEAEEEALRARAQEAGRKAMASFRAGQYEEAYNAFRIAEEHFHTPQLVLFMARCQAKRGKLLEARALYERMLAEVLPENASASLLRARQAATDELGTTRLRISTLAVDVRGPPISEVTVFVDNEVFPLDEPRELDPGKHNVEALSRSGARTTREVDLPEGRSVSIVLRLGLFAQGTTRPAERVIVSSDGSFSPYQTGALAAFSLGGIGLLVGIAAGGAAIAQKNVVEQQCVLTACSDKGIVAVSRADSLATWSNLGFAFGALGAGTGGLLWYFGKKADPKRDAAASFSIMPGPSSITVRGVF